MNMLNPRPCTVIKQWEEHSATLVTTFKSYTDLCLGLGADSQHGGAQWSDLVPRIDSALEVHARVSHYLEESNRALARVRNKFASILHIFPQEVLLEIFLNVVFDRGGFKESSPPSMEQDVRFIYQRLYGLIGVCSTWMDLIMTNGTFWTVVPMVTSPSGKGRQFELCLQRAGRNVLHLAANNVPYMSSKDVAVVLAEHGYRFRTINISMSDEEAIKDTVSELLKHTHETSLSELSIQLDEFPRNSNYIISRDSPEQAKFASLIKSLSAFRLYGADFHWDTFAFSSRLVELRIEQIALGYDDAIFPFIQALTPATNLRDLKIIAVSTVYRSEETRNPTLSSPVALPALQSLTIEGLYLNTIECLLPIIAPGSHRLMLFLSQNSRQVNFLEKDEMEDGEIFDFDGLCRILASTTVDTLILTGGANGEWLAACQLTRLLRSIPTLKTLKMNQWRFGSDLCKHLTRTSYAPTSSEHAPLPALQTLQLSLVEILDNVLFKTMIISHPLRQVVLGGFSRGIKTRTCMGAGCEPLQADSDILQWLRENIPNLDLRLMEKEYCPSEFYRDQWRLW